MKNMSFFKKMLKSKKGIAIESAIATSIVVFSLCSILLMTVVFSAQNRIRIERDFEERTAACEIAEAYVDYHNDDSQDKGGFTHEKVTPEAYQIEVDPVENSTTRLTITKDNKTILTVEIKDKEVVLWRYGG